MDKLSQQRSFLMGCAMVGIILFHQQYVDTPFKYFGYWGVDVFMYLSGMGMVYSLNKNTLRNFYLNRLLRIVPAFLIVSALFMTWNVSQDMPWYSVFQRGKLWFIRIIICFYLLAPVLKWALEKWRSLFFVLLFLFCGLVHTVFILYQHSDSVLGSVFSSSQLHWFFAWAPSRLPVFTLGMAMAMFLGSRRWEKISDWRSPWWLALLILIVAVKLGGEQWCAEHMGIALPVHLSRYEAFALCMVVPVVSIAIARVGAWLESGMWFAWRGMVFCGVCSLEIYLWHEWFFEHDLVFFGWLPEVMKNRFFMLPLMVGVSLFAAWGLHVICGPFAKLRSRSRCPH